MCIISGRSRRLKQLDDKCYQIMHKGYRPNTVRNKRCFATSYQHFCDSYEVPEMPADEWQLVRYAVHTAVYVTSPRTVDNYVSGVRSLQRLAGYTVPAANAPNLKLVMDSIKAYLAKPLQQATPITLQMLAEIADKIDYDNEFQHCLYACMLTGFYLVLRNSNLVPSSHKKFDAHEQLTRWHVGIEEGMAIFIIEWSKNNQNYKRELIVPVKPAKDPRVCLIRVLKRYFEKVPAQDHKPCFCYHNAQGQLKALTYGQLNKYMKEIITATGRDGKRYSTHGIRRGGINFAVRTGLAPEFLQVLGDWGSQCFLRYIDFALDLRLMMAEHIAQHE